MAVHLLWALWGVMNCESPIAFGYLDFTLARLDAYGRHRVRVWPLGLQHPADLFYIIDLGARKLLARQPAPGVGFFRPRHVTDASFE